MRWFCSSKASVVRLCILFSFSVFHSLFPEGFSEKEGGAKEHLVRRELQMNSDREASPIDVLFVMAPPYQVLAMT